MFDTTLKCVKIDEHKQLEQQAAYYNGIMPTTQTTRKFKHGY